MILNQTEARKLAFDIFKAYGATNDNAQVVVEHLIAADLAGIPSHGLIRVPQYVDEILNGEIKPAEIPSIVETSISRIDIDGKRTFGQVSCKLAVESAKSLACERGVALVTIKNTGHVGRIGSYAQSFGEQGLLSIIFCSGPPSGHRVAPHNGKEGRLSTNPISFSIPTETEPIVGDFSTASTPEGRIRHLRDNGLPVPPETLLDETGRPTTDPNILYGENPGTIMPFGGLRLGHRGFALGLLVEALATLLPKDETTDNSRIGNNITFIVILPDSEFSTRAQRMADYVLSSSRRDKDPVILPGYLEQQSSNRSADITINDSVWQAICERAETRGISLH